MLIMPSFKKSLIVEQFQGNYLNLVVLFVVVICQDEETIYNFTRHGNYFGSTFTQISTACHLEFGDSEERKWRCVLRFTCHCILFSVSFDTKTRSPLMIEYSSVCLPKIGNSDIIEFLRVAFPITLKPKTL